MKAFAVALLVIAAMIEVSAFGCFMGSAMNYDPVPGGTDAKLAMMGLVLLFGGVLVGGASVVASAAANEHARAQLR